MPNGMNINEKPVYRMVLPYKNHTIIVTPISSGKFVCEIVMDNGKVHFIKRASTNNLCEFDTQAEAIYNAVRLANEIDKQRGVWNESI